MKTVIDSAMETMHVLGEPVARIRAAVEEFFSQHTPMSLALDKEAERITAELGPFPERAFPDSFYYRPVPAEDLPKGKPVIDVFPSRPQWIPHRPKPEIAYPGQWCHCGHKWEEHMPCCVHLVEGCSCEEFMRVPMGVSEGG